MNLTRYIKIGIVFLLIVLIGLGGYFLFKKKISEKSKNDKPDRKKSDIEIVMDIVTNDPEIALAMIDPKVRAAFQDIRKNLANAKKYEDDPKIGPLIEKVMAKFKKSKSSKSKSSKSKSKKTKTPKKPQRKQPSTNVSKPVVKAEKSEKIENEKTEGPPGASEVPAGVTQVSDEGVDYYDQLFQITEPPALSGGGGGGGGGGDSRNSYRTGGGGGRRSGSNQVSNAELEQSRGYDVSQEENPEDEDEDNEVEPFDLYRKSYSDIF
tara:strand:- start:597 stop:1391 length:795 start_codon:yes stop_codon:yes gene_type:complete